MYRGVTELSGGGIYPILSCLAEVVGFPALGTKEGRAAQEPRSALSLAG